MFKAISVIVVATCLGAVAGTAVGQAPIISEPSPVVRVEFAQPERYTDAGDRQFADRGVRSGYLELLRRHLIRRATPLIPQGQLLSVTITELDMAGSFDPSRSRPGGVRVVTDVYPPRINLRFAVTQEGAVIAEGERKLRNLDFLTTTLFYRGDALRYEKALLDNWLSSEFSGPAAR